MHYFRIFFNKVNKPCVKFLRVWTKNANCWDILRKFSNIFKTFLRKFLKMQYYSIFSKNLTNRALNFCTFGRKTKIVGKILKIFDENSIENLNFYFIFILENLLLKIVFGNNTIFNNIFFGWGGGFSPFPHWLRPCYHIWPQDRYIIVERG